jgi:F0F1-type ATP synthase membrane subunit c/vacuolar-type H+-ATPase subunit K
MQDLLNWIGGVASVVALLGAVIAFLLSAFYKRITMMSKEMAYSKEATIEKLRADISMLQSSITELPKGEEGQAVESRVLTERMNKLEQDMRGLRELLFDNPEATVTIPLMKKDVESLARENDVLRRELDRQSGSTKWFLGILITLSVGLLGLAVSILLK